MRCPQPHHDPSRPGPQCRGDELADALAVGRQRGLGRGRAAKQPQTTSLRTLQIRGCRARIEHPRRVHDGVQWPANTQPAGLS